MAANNELKYNQLITDLKSKKFHPIYFFLGEEDFLKEEAINIIKKSILTSDVSKDFNYNHLYGTLTSISKVLDITNTLPVFSDKRMVIVDEFDKSKQVDKLNEYIKNPSTHSVLILKSNETKLPKGIRTNKNCIKVIFYPLWESELRKWIIDRVGKFKKRINMDAVDILIEYCNNSLTEINNEIGKLILFTGEKEIITLDDVKNLTGDINMFSIFALTDALANRNFKNSIKIYRRINQKESDSVTILSAIYSFFHKLWHIDYLLNGHHTENEIISQLGLNPYRYKKIVSAKRKFSSNDIKSIILTIADYDILLKTGSNLKKSALMEECLYKICSIKTKNFSNV